MSALIDSNVARWSCSGLSPARVAIAFPGPRPITWASRLICTSSASPPKTALIARSKVGRATSSPSSGAAPTHADSSCL